MFDFQGFLKVYNAATEYQIISFWWTAIGILTCYIAAVVSAEIIKDKFVTILFVVTVLGYVVFGLIAGIIGVCVAPEDFTRDCGPLAHAFNQYIYPWISIPFFFYSLFFGIRNIVRTQRRIDEFMNSEEVKEKEKELQRIAEAQVNSNLPPEQRRPVKVKIDPPDDLSYLYFLVCFVASVVFIFAMAYPMLPLK